MFVIAVLSFAVENMQLVTMSFLGSSAQVPLALLVASIYLLGMITGSSLVALLRRSIKGAQLHTLGRP